MINEHDLSSCEEKSSNLKKIIFCNFITIFILWKATIWKISHNYEIIIKSSKKNQELTNFVSKSNKLVNCCSSKLITKINYIKMRSYIILVTNFILKCFTVSLIAIDQWVDKKIKYFCLFNKLFNSIYKNCE